MPCPHSSSKTSIFIFFKKITIKRGFAFVNKSPIDNIYEYSKENHKVKITNHSKEKKRKDYERKYNEKKMKQKEDETKGNEKEKK